MNDNQPSPETGPPLVSVVMPAFDEAEGIEAVIGRVHAAMTGANLSYEILVADDGSGDDTAQIARHAGARVVSHPYNIGNGAAVKTGIRNARGEIIVLLDADGQHPPELIPKLVAELSTFHMAVGARTSDSDTHAHRNLANFVYNGLASYVTGRKIPDLTSGFRAVRAHVARQFVSLLPNTFSYPSTITLAMMRSGYAVTFVPIVAAKRKGKSKIRIFRDGSRFFFIIIRIATLFAPMKVFLPASLVMFFAGLIYGLVKIFVLHHPYGPTSAMLMTVAILIFMIGLVSEQVTQLRFDQASRDHPCGPES